MWYGVLLGRIPSIGLYQVYPIPKMPNWHQFFHPTLVLGAQADLWSGHPHPSISTRCPLVFVGWVEKNGMATQSEWEANFRRLPRFPRNFGNLCGTKFRGDSAHVLGDFLARGKLNSPKDSWFFLSPRGWLPWIGSMLELCLHRHWPIAAIKPGHGKSPSRGCSY